jgi:hypothetical protein
MQVGAPAAVLFSLFYGLLCTGIVLQFREFASAGISAASILSVLSPVSEDTTFVQYHMYKTVVTQLLQASLPLGNC